MRQSNMYTMVFVIIMSLAAALILSVSSTMLRERQERNIETDIKRNILLAVNLMKNGSDAAKLYDMYIQGVVVNAKGDIIKTPVPAEKIDLETELEKTPGERRYPVFISSEKSGIISAYCVPIVGKGLWSTIYGYIALETDLNRVKGITFYKHGETPGLGGEIESVSFQKNFQGKSILSADGSLVSVSIVKGKVRNDSQNFAHEVDGISGATLTSAGVSRLLKDCLKLYEPYFIKVRKKK